MSWIQFLFLLIWQFYILQGKFLLVDTEEKELLGNDKSLDHDGNRLIKHYRNRKKKNMKPKIQKNLKSAGREHTMYSQKDENRGFLNSLCAYAIPTPVFICDALVRK